MARTKAQEGDAIARITDASEDALRQLIDFPHRAVHRAVEDVRKQLHYIANRLRAIDPLVARVTVLEQRLDTVEKAAKPTRRKGTARKKTPPSLPPDISPTPTGPTDQERPTPPELPDHERTSGEHTPQHNETPQRS